MRILFALLAVPFFLTGCQSDLTHWVAIKPTVTEIPEPLLTECFRDLPLPKGATPPQVAQVVAHDKAVLRQCRRAKRALNAAVRAAQEES